MNEINSLISEILLNNNLIKGVFSNLRYKSNEYKKISIKPVFIKNEIKVQFEYIYEKKVTHENLNINDAIKKINSLLKDVFRQAILFTPQADYQILISKKGKTKIIKNKPSKSIVNISHNKKKNYIIEENKPCEFLIRLGVMNEEGKVYKKKYDKFRQINKFLEIIQDTLKRVEIDKNFRIVDFGCGKSYLTFALYHYLVNILKKDVKIIGLDLKKDVIEFCNEVAIDLKYENLKFIQGDIKDYKELENVDMVVTLHACDTATDLAIAKAVNWNAKVILSVPCCQHEINSKLNVDVLKPMLRHGIIKEKLSSLITDSIRANVLEILGYNTSLLEFIDMEHTPKNILIRAIKVKDFNKNKIEEYLKFKRLLNLNDLFIEDILSDKLDKIYSQ